MWKIILVRQATGDNTGFMCIVYSITKATETHSEYVIPTSLPTATMVTRIRLL